MKNEVKLSNKYYPWDEVKLEGATYHIKGNVFLENKLLSPRELAELMYPLVCNEGPNQEKKIEYFLKELNGEFSVVVETKDKIFCALDKLRSIPLFYTITNTGFILSDDAYYLKSKLKQNLNEKNAAEFMVAGYVTGNETLFDGIKQTRSGEFLIYQKKENKLKSFFYFRFLHGDYYNLPEEELYKILDQAFANTFLRLIESTVKQGKKLVVPLSGGLDSRIIVAMLKRLGIEDVICVTYGRKGNRESLISKRVAKALGYNWLFIEQTAQKWHKCYRSEEANSYHKFAGNLSSLPHMQDFLAVQELKNKGKIPENSVFIPGHTGDMLSGSHIPEYYLDNSKIYNNETFLTDTLKMHYNLWKWNSIYGLEPIFKAKVNKSASDLEIKDNQTCANAIEFFDFNERQAKFIVNAVRVYEFFGYEWRIPFWDGELINFFLKIPAEQRINQELYIKYVRNHLFSGELKILKEIDCTTDILDLTPLEKRSLYEKLLHYRTFIHSYYDESINNPNWGRYFKYPLISKFLTKYSTYNNKAFEEYPLLTAIIEARNKNKDRISINGISTLEYIASIKEGNSSPSAGICFETNYPLTKRVLQLVNMKSGKT